MKKLFLTFLTIIFVFTSAAQTRTAGGRVTDAANDKPMEYISVYFKNTASGCLTDYRGDFFVTDSSGADTLVVDAIGYEKVFIRLKPGQNNGLKIKMKQANIQLTEAVVKPKRERYRKKENPAIELIRNVIANKGNNRIESKG